MTKAAPQALKQSHITRNAFSIALVILLIVLGLWHSPLRAQSTLLYYLPNLSYVAGGFIIGAMVENHFVPKVALLGVIAAVITGLAHWIAIQLGAQLDMTTTEGIFFVALLSAPIGIVSGIFGGLFGWLIFKKWMNK